MSRINTNNPVAVNSDILWCSNINTIFNEIEYCCILNIDISGTTDFNTKTFAMMNGRVWYLAPSACSSIESNGGFESIVLRTIVNFNIVNYCIALSELTISFDEVSCQKLTSPVLAIVTHNFNISCEKHDLTSHVYSTIIGSGWNTLTPMIII
jgi:hypothetical protein